MNILTSFCLILIIIGSCFTGEPLIEFKNSRRFIDLPAFEAPNIDWPNFNHIEWPKFTAPRIDWPKFPKLGNPLPRVGSIKVAVPNLEIKSFNPPKLELPTFSAPKFILPEISPPKIELPKFPITWPKIDIPKLAPPGPVFVGGSIKGLEVRGGHIELPKVKKPAHFSLPDIPRVEAEKPIAKTPKLRHIKLPKVELPKLEAPKFSPPRIQDRTIELPKIKLPKVEPPKIELSKIEDRTIQLSKIELPKDEPPKVEPPTEPGPVQPPKDEPPQIETRAFGLPDVGVNGVCGFDSDSCGFGSPCCPGFYCSKNDFQCHVRPYGPKRLIYNTEFGGIAWCGFGGKECDVDDGLQCCPGFVCYDFKCRIVRGGRDI